MMNSQILLGPSSCFSNACEHLNNSNKKLLFVFLFAIIFFLRLLVLAVAANDTLLITFSCIGVVVIMVFVFKRKIRSQRDRDNEHQHALDTIESNLTSRLRPINEFATLSRERRVSDESALIILSSASDCIFFHSNNLSSSSHENMEIFTSSFNDMEKKSSCDDHTQRENYVCNSLADADKDFPKRLKVLLESSCSVCLDNYEENEIIQVIRQCGHAFHTECLVRWIQSGGTRCPLCMQSSFDRSIREGWSNQPGTRPTMPPQFDEVVELSPVLHVSGLDTELPREGSMV